MAVRPDPDDFRSVLVASPDREAGLALCRTLTAYGYDSELCAGTEEALGAARGRLFWLAFIDLDLPGGGLSLALELRAHSPQSAVVLMAGRETFDDAVKAIRIGAYDYLPKPVDPGELALTLTRFRERLRLEDLAFQAQQQYARLVQNIPVVIFAQDRSGRLEFVNQACYFLLGEDPARAIGTPDWLLARVEPADRERIGQALTRAFGSASPVTIQCRLVHASGRSLPCLIKTMPCLPATGGSCERLEGVILDITDRVLLEQSLVQDEKLKTLGAVSAEMAHELRNPLVAISGFARRLRRRLPEAGEDLDIILSEAARLERLLERIKDYLRPLAPLSRRCSLNALVSEAVNLLYSELQSRGVAGELRLEPDLPPVAADPDILSQVITSVVLSGLASAEPGRVMTIATVRSEERIQAVFRHSPGQARTLDAELLRMPFDEDGQHLGLPVSCRLMRQMGGVLDISRQGSELVVVLTLPPAGEAVEPGEAEVPDQESEQLFSEDVRFDEQLRREWERGRRGLSPLAVLLVEVDHFGAYAESMGRREASRMLAAVAGAVRGAMGRPDDFLDAGPGCRLSAVLPGTNEVGALLAAEAIRQAVDNLALPHPASLTSDHVTVSIGVAAMVPELAGSPEELFAEAARALRRAKAKGRNVVSTPAPGSSSGS
jgi:diguanylate cyclase (GGDEF)-like protein/PAS domain S-box-containing protein